ncbi:zinc finger and BTB domain-containing protein 12-like isoform X2 [Sitophilus oryzae]|uniref:Zinc finger and BTB domain-containing protein 12-like isoform X2 n=1 Tax=Sitophilus oryzae TaxID=7048 RepID=A0A6J2XW75_SITOR|nr:zinc finger and BTB domain-containing protein 12-like isoform X2 [Sitophilus oryzae]
MEVGDQFSLCWNNFHTNLSTGFHSLLEDEDLVDVTLAADGKYLKAHKTVLSVCSPFFKDLFRVNPCKHPIVILPDVNYEALKNLLHFMYHGEVSVSQEEIPTFMKVAETLRVKGLTDNTSDNTNGFQSASSYSDQKRNEYRKRSRPSRKLIRPLQSLRPLETPKPEPSQSPKLNPLPPPVPLVMPHPPKLVTPPPALSVAPPEEESLIQPSLGSPIENPLALIKPKEEIVDHSDTGSQGAMDENMELSSMLDIQLSGGEPSPSQLTPPWPAPPDSSGMGSNDDSQPGLAIIKSGKGQLVLIHNGHMYTRSNTNADKSLWVCVKTKTLSCKGAILTKRGQVLGSTDHNHYPIQDVISRIQLQNAQNRAAEQR